MCLAAISLGLRLMTTALMATRANMLGGIHFHRLFCLPIQKIQNTYRIAEIAIAKMNRSSNIKFLYFILTMDMLMIDEIGQLSAQQIDVIDIILRTIRETSIPFGGVHIFGMYNIYTCM